MEDQLKSTCARTMAETVLQENIETNIEEVLQQVKASAQKGKFEMEYEGNLSEIQINQLKFLGYIIKKVGRIKEGGDLFKVSW